MTLKILSFYSSRNAIDALRSGKAHIAIYLNKVYCRSSVEAKMLLSTKGEIFSKGAAVEGFTGVLVLHSGEPSTTFAAVVNVLKAP